MDHSWVRRTAGIIGVVLLLWMLPAITVASPSDKYLLFKGTSTPVVPTSSDGAGTFPQPPLGLIGRYGYDIPSFTAHDNHAYVMEGNRLRVLSYVDPLNVTVVAEMFHSDPFYAVGISPDGTRLFALTGSYYSTQNDILSLYDVSNPAQPQLLTTVRAPFGQMHVHGNRLYLTTFASPTLAAHLQVYSWENDRLTVVGETSLVLYERLRMLFDGGVLVVASYSGTNSHENIALYDISDDSAPEFKRTIQTIGGIAVPLNGYLYVSNGGYVDIWDIRDLDTASIVQTYAGYFVPLATHDNLILASGNRFYDVTNPTDIRLAGEADGFTFRGSVWNSNGDIYTMQSAYPIEYLQRVALSDTFQAIPVGDYKPPAYYAAVPVTDRYLYLFGTTHTGIDIHDMQNPAQPRLVATILQDHFTWPPTRDYFIVDGRLYLYRSGNVEVLDVTNPVAPISVATIPLGSDWLLESVANGYLYALKNQSNRIRVLRLHDLEGQSIEFPDADRCSGLDTEGTMMVLACDDLRVYDITVPTAPVLVGTLPTSLALLQPTLELPYLYVTSMTQTAIYDLSNPASPRYVTSIPAPFPLTAEGAFPEESGGSYVCPELIPVKPSQYLRQCIFSDSYPPEAQWEGPTDIVDLSDPLLPRRSESMYAPFARGIVQGDTVVVAGERLSVWHFRGFLDKTVFLPLVEMETP